MTREDVLPDGAQVEWEETTWTRWTRDGKTAWWGTHYGVYAHIGGIAARIMDEVYHLRAQLAGVRERVEKLDRYDPIVDCNEPYMEHTERGDYFSCADVLAALGGDA